MNKKDLYEMLSAMNEPKTTANWLRDTYFPEIAVRFNSEESRKRFGLYQNERIPTNERNLTDVRTRMGVLIEFELARISNEVLVENQIDDLFWSYVVANRFPDLEIRKNNGDRQLRLEIKCLQCVAEEKSANFDTLMKDINPLTDYVIVCLWDWNREKSSLYDWDSVPTIYKIYVFHAYSLASLRDCYWLNNPPTDLGNGYQGFDIRYAVTCKNGVYSKEQGNYGKLTRIWKENFEYRPEESEVLLDTEQEYLLFQKEIVFEGFKILVKEQITSIYNDTTIIPAEVQDNNTVIGYNYKKFLYLFKSRLSTNSQSYFKTLANSNNAEIIICLTDKYNWTVYCIQNNDIQQYAKGNKPKNLFEALNQL